MTDLTESRMRQDARVPTLPEVRELFTVLFGREVEVHLPDVPMALEPGRRFFAGVYLDERRHVRGVLACDAQFAVRASAALSLFPAHQVDALAEKGDLDENFAENLHEILNVATRFFHGSFETSTTVARVFELPKESPDELFQLVALAIERTDYTVDVQGYGEGRLALIYV